MSESPPAYRPDIDGLRAVAVLAVVAYHAAPRAVSGGFAGVDIFFVISGFLITTIILTGMKEGRFSIAGFYARRVRRIFPALAVVLLAVMAAGYLVMSANEFAALGRTAAGGAGFAANLQLLGEAGYFEPSAEANPLLHLWSLGVEEQFYIVQPVLIWLAMRWRLNVLAVAGVLGGASFGLNIVVRHHLAFDFYAPQTRFWELLVGTMLAAWTLERRAREGGRWMGNAMAAGGVALIGLAVLGLTGERAYPGWWAVLPVAGAALVIAAGERAALNRAVLSHPAMVAVGLISYPLYLWHWPLLSFLRVAQGETADAGLRVTAVCLSFGLAWATYRMVEKPLRSGGNLRVKAAGLVAVVAGTGLLGLGVVLSGGMPGRTVAQATAGIDAAKTDWGYRETRLKGGRIEGLHIAEGSTAERVLFIGDSTMGQYYPRAEVLYARAVKPVLSAVFAARNHCRPEPFQSDVSGPDHAKCADYYVAAMALAREPGVRRVVLGGRWRFGAARPELAESEARLVADIARLTGTGTQVIILGWPPQAAAFEPDRIAAAYRAAALVGAGAPPAELALARADVEAASAAANARMAAIAARSGAKFVNVYDGLCGPSECPYVSGGRPLYLDHLHIRASTARQRATFIDALVGAP